MAPASQNTVITAPTSQPCIRKFTFAVKALKYKHLNPGLLDPSGAGAPCFKVGIGVGAGAEGSDH